MEIALALDITITAAQFIYNVYQSSQAISGSFVLGVFVVPPGADLHVYVFSSLQPSTPHSALW